jgi:hypothetical protein
MGKQVELVRELMPHATTVGGAIASAAGIKVVAASATSQSEIAPAFQKLSQAGARHRSAPAARPRRRGDRVRRREFMSAERRSCGVAARGAGATGGPDPARRINLKTAKALRFDISPINARPR